MVVNVSVFNDSVPQTTGCLCEVFWYVLLSKVLKRKVWFKPYKPVTDLLQASKFSSQHNRQLC